MLWRQLRIIAAIGLAIAVAWFAVALHRQNAPAQTAANQGGAAGGGAAGGGGAPAPGGGGGGGAAPGGGAPGGAPPPPAVTVVTLRAQDVTLHTTLPGRVVAFAVAEVRPQVDGIITERLFIEGEPVTLGDPLYRIDDATYRAAGEAARAAVAQAQAQFEASLKEADRTSRLQGRGVVSDQDLDTAVANRDAAAAQLQVAQAQLLSAEIDLERTTIRAPLTGIIGRSITTRGALVTAGQTEALATIRSIDPVLVDVTQSSAEIIAFKRGQTRQRLGDADLTVSLILADGTTYPQTGTLTAAEPYVDEQTGVVTLRLEFPNPEQLLLPGMYVQVELPQGTRDGAILAPQEGVTRDRRGNPIAYIVTPDNRIEQRSLTIAEGRGSDWVVTDGLGDGDRMVVAGLQRIAPGATVRPEERPADPQENVEELNAPTAATRAEEAEATPPTGIAVPGAGDTAPAPSPEATGAGAGGQGGEPQGGQQSGDAEASSGTTSTEAGSTAPRAATPRRRDEALAAR